MRRKILLFLLCAIMLCSITGCGSDMQRVEQCARQYLQAFQDGGMAEAVQYCHFEANEFYSSDDHRQLYIRSGCAIQDYRIQKIDKVNDRLYALTLTLQDDSGLWKTVYHFVGYIDGAFHYINGIHHIPPALCTGLDREAYRTADIAVARALYDRHP